MIAGCRRFLLSFQYAWSGIVYGIARERNMLLHMVAAICAILATIVLNITILETLFVYSAIGMVISLELMNTSLERAIDLISPKYHPIAKFAKDAAAGSVCIGAIYAFIVGVCVFGTKLIPLNIRHFET